MWTSSSFGTTEFSNLISESKLDNMLQNTHYRNARNPCPLLTSWRGRTGKAFDIGDDPHRMIMGYSP
jgi:hypothetical protein